MLFVLFCRVVYRYLCIYCVLLGNTCLFYKIGKRISYCVVVTDSEK